MNEASPGGVSRIRNAARRLSLSPAVMAILATRVWHLFSGIVTVSLITWRLNPETQGFYYVFASYLALQSFVELGLPGIFVVLASHEWAALSLGEDRSPAGDSRALSRLASLVKFGDRYFGAWALVFAAGLGAVGWALIDSNGPPSHPVVSWRAPWLAAVAVVATSLVYVPRLAILEGCQQVAQVHSMRLVQGIASSVASWTGLLLGAELWVIAILHTVRLIGEATLVHGRYGRFFGRLRVAGGGEQISWSEEIWPLQWRLIPQTIGAYFCTSFFTIVVDRFHGKAAAARMGLTWTIASALQTSSLAWLQARTPDLGGLIARGERTLLHSRFRQTVLLTMSFYLLGGAAFLAVLQAFELAGWRVANRFLTTRTTLWLLIALGGVVLSMCLHVFVRLHKRDPFLIPNTFSSTLTAVLIYALGRSSGAAGAIGGYAVWTWLFTVPMSVWIFVRLVKERDN